MYNPYDAIHDDYTTDVETDIKQQQYMDAVVEMAKLEDELHIPETDRFTVYKTVGGKIYPFENDRLVPENYGIYTSDEYKNSIVQLYKNLNEKVNSIKKEIADFYTVERASLMSISKKRPDYDEIKTVADYEERHAVPYSQRQTKWFGDYNMYQTISHYSPEKFYKMLTLAYNENQEKQPQTRSNISIRFAKKQIYGEHNVSVDGQDIAYVNVALPKASKYHGYSLSIKKDSIRDDKYSPKMAFFSISDKTYTLSNWDKETKTAGKIDLSAKEIQKEFNAWKEKRKDVPTR